MKHRFIMPLAATTLALPLLLGPAPARADHKITVDYDTFDNAGVVCVQDAPTMKANDKKLKIKKLGQVITWELKRGQGAEAEGTWTIQRDVGGSVEMCPDTLSFTNGVARCSIGTELEYAYDVTWSKAGCADVVADPVVIFDGGGGTPPSPYGLAGPFFALALGLGVGFGLGYVRGRRHRATS